MANHSAIFPSVYLGPIEYYIQLLKHSSVAIEQFENWQKQTYRNRCYIYGANGTLLLNIPIIHKKGERQIIKDVRISYAEDWRKLHQKSFESAYRTSPYFEFYEDEFLQFYSKKYTYLYDLNIELNNWIIEQLNISIDIQETSAYQKLVAENVIDNRSSISPKIKTDIQFNKYMQVFDNKYGFIENLSVIDLLFNEGPNSISYLEMHI